jgi:hypothetical protein
LTRHLVLHRNIGDASQGRCFDLRLLTWVPDWTRGRSFINVFDLNATLLAEPPGHFGASAAVRTVDRSLQRLRHLHKLLTALAAERDGLRKINPAFRASFHERTP